MKIILLFLLLSLSAVFSAYETAIFSIPSFSINTFAKKSFSAKLLYKLYSKPNFTLPLILMCNTFVNVLLSIISLKVLTDFLMKWNFSNLMILWINILVVTGFLLLFGEFSPKLLSIRKAEKIALICSPFIFLLSIIFYPIIKPFEYVIYLFTKNKSKDSLTSSELIRMFYHGRIVSKVLKGNIWKISHSLMMLGDTVAENIMIPRKNIISVEINSSWENIFKIKKDNNISQILIYKETIDNICGVVDLNRLMLCESYNNYPVMKYIEKIDFIPHIMKLSNILKRAHTKRKIFFVVKDEYGGTAGIITKNELYKYFMDSGKGIKKKKKHGNISWIVKGDNKLSEISNIINCKFPHNSMELTIGKYIIDRLGYFPSKGEVISIDESYFKVLKAKRNEIFNLEILNKKK